LRKYNSLRLEIRGYKARMRWLPAGSERDVMSKHIESLEDVKLRREKAALKARYKLDKSLL